MTEAELLTLGYSYVRDVDGGGRLAALGANPRQLLTDFDKGGWSQGWCYVSPTEALMALCAWDGVGEPDGWIRHMPSMRRRMDGMEYVQDFERHAALRWFGEIMKMDRQAAESEVNRLLEVWEREILPRERA